MQASQYWQADQYQRHAAFVAAHGEAVLNWQAAAGAKVAGIDGSAAILQQAGTQLRVTLLQENAYCVADYVRLRFEARKT